MSQQDFELNYDYPGDASTLYAQFATAEGVEHWWTENCEMDERIDGVATFPFPEVDFYAFATITELTPTEVVEWKVTDSKHPDRSGWVDLNDWVGTKIRFEIRAIDEQRAHLCFRHKGLVPLECSDACSSLWQFYLNESLRRYLQQGVGKPYADGQNREF